MKTLALATFALLPAALPAQKPDTTIPAGSHAPLAPFAGRTLVVLPVSWVLEGDALGWAAQIPDVDQYRQDFDAELEFALKERGLGKVWVMVSKLPAEYKRNEDYMADPTHIAGDFLRYPGPKKPIEYLPDPLASQLRSILAVNDKAEFVLYPIELRFIQAPDGPGGRLALRVAIIDPRRLKIGWMGDVFSSTYQKFSPALLASLAEHLANNFVIPQP